MCDSKFCMKIIIIAYLVLKTVCEIFYYFISFSPNIIKETIKENVHALLLISLVEPIKAVCLSVCLLGSH